MDVVCASVRLACLVLTKCPVLHGFRESAEEVLEAASDCGEEYMQLFAAYKAMRTASAELRRANRAFVAVSAKHGLPQWTDQLNPAYTRDREQATAAYDTAKQTHAQRTQHFHHLAQCFIDNTS
jgi:hypothetical protein